MTLSYQGTEYPSVKAIAESVGVWHERITWRMRVSRMGLEQAVQSAIAAESRDKAAATDEQVFEFLRTHPEATSSTLAAKFGMSLSSANDKLLDAVSLGIVPSQARIHGTRGEVEVNGKKYPSLLEACRDYGYSYTRTWHRICKGKSVQEAFDMGAEQCNKKSVTICGKQYASLRDAEKHFGLPLGILFSRINNGWTIDKAATTPVPAPAADDQHAGYFVYKYTHKETGRGYVGLTVCLAARDRSHIGAALSGKYTAGGIDEAIALHGRDAFHYEMLKDCAGPNEMRIAEKKLIHKHRTLAPHGYNLHPGGAWRVGSKKLFEIGDLQFSSMASAARYFGITAINLRSRLKSGWTKEEAVGLVDKDYVCKPEEVTFRGVLYPNWTQLANAFDAPAHSSRARFREGWTVEQALRLAPPPERKLSGTVIPPRAIVYRGVHYRSVDRCAKAVGVKGARIASALRSGYKGEAAVERAILLTKLNQEFGVPTSPENVCEFRGKRYASVTQLTEAFGINSATYSLRIASGWSQEEALGLAQRHNPNSIQFDGVEYESMKHAMAALKLDPGKVRQLIKHGHTQIEALHIVFIRRKFMLVCRELPYKQDRLTAFERFVQEHGDQTMGDFEQFAATKCHHYWTKERVLADALLYKTAREWREASGQAYNTAKNGGYLDETTVTKRFAWTRELCIAEAKKHQKVSWWKAASQGSYQAAKNKGWFEECRAHLKKKKGGNGSCTPKLRK